MLALEFFTWWYSQGWALLARNARRRVIRTSHLFSLPVLIRTLFAPWKRILTYPGAGFEAKVRAATDNLVSRFVGFFVRIFVLFFAGLILLLVCLAAIVQLIAWPLLPPAALILLVKGLI
jgi:hypothetical protein